MLHVRQKGLMDCGVAVAAMVTGIPYEKVLDRWFGCLSVEGGLSEIGLWRILEDITQSNWQLSCLREPWPQVSAYSFPGVPTAVLIQGHLSARHYIAVHGHLVHDPLFATSLVQDQYPKGDWRIQTIITPTIEEREGNWR
ncbi:MAG: hypothetical protein L0Z62_06610 [Gemmataceae bacterium]|nr:hypothetical protein [Gemmataceae bacterium]